MPNKLPQLAKLSRPRLHAPVVRERLFALLDEKREHPVVWIVGPPGSGKTTLAASYVEEAGVPAIWYQIDPGDSDPATFFYYLKQGVERIATRKVRPLPLLSPEYLSDLQGFSSRFLRASFAQIPEDAMLIFDNYHEIAPDSMLHGAFATALAEIPPSVNLLVLSRTDPPSTLASSVIAQTIALVSWGELRLAPEETEVFALARGINDPRMLRSLHQQSGGWIAGLTLMLERLHSGMSLDKLNSTGGLDTVFDYFAGLIFDQGTEEFRDILMRTAFLPRVSAALAETVTGKPDAIRSLEDLYRRHLFTDRNVGEEITYQYHALFKAFLKNRATAAFPIDQRRAILYNAGLASEAADQWEEAFFLFTEGEQWVAAQDLVIKRAPMLIALGRSQTLQEWVKALPEQIVLAAPWLRYWLGRSQMFVDPRAAREMLNEVYLCFEERGDESGQLQCATAVLESLYFYYREFRLMDPWIVRITYLLGRDVVHPTPEYELWIHSMLLMAVTYRDPENTILNKSLLRVKQLLSNSSDPDLIVSVATVLHTYAYSVIDIATEQLAIRTARPLLGSPDLTAGRAAFYLVHEGYTHYVHGRYAQACSCYDEADAIAIHHGLEGTALTSAIWRALSQRRAGLLSEAEETIRRAEAFPDGSRFPDAPLEFVKACIEFERGNHGSAMSAILRSQAICEAGGSHIGVMLVGIVSANIMIGAGDFMRAAELLQRARQNILGPVTEHYLGAIVLNEAWLAHRRTEFGRRDELLLEALRRANDERVKERYRWYTNALSELLPIAMVRRLEADVACNLARELNIVPEPRDVEQWPWPIKVYTLGGFELLIDGAKTGYTRKAPKKVLALLQAMIAFGARDVPDQKLIDVLWLDSAGDAARRSLAATVHRLRKLLAHGDAIRQVGGKFTLDSRCCWVDSIVFEEMLDRAAGREEESSSAIRLYRGPFLSQEDDAPCLVPTRERLRARFMHAVGKVGASLEKEGAHEKAIEVYWNGIEADNLVEPFYQGLMRCYDKLDRRSEAASAYRRLRQTLSVILGVAPSSETQRLFDTLRLS